MEEEIKYFENVISVTKKIIFANKLKINEAKSIIVNEKRHLYENQREIGDDDLSEAYNEEDRKVQDLNNIIRKNISLNHSLESPYFGRVDFKENNDTNKVYIGLTSIQDDNDFLVYDWRAPISNIYYNYGVGKTKFNGEDIEVTLKRQYQIKMGKFLNFVDTNVALDDELLQDVLIKSPTDKMKNIVSTIQKEQNEIIRHKGNENLVIEGVAGSGKTAIILHRVAYLLYNTKDLSSKNAMIISPNDAFTDYISGVLPELGEENIKAASLDKVLKKLIKKPIESQGEYINRTLKEEVKQISLEDLDKYIKEYSHKLAFKNGVALGSTVLKYDELNDILKNKTKNLSISNKVEYIATKMLSLLNKKETEKNINKMSSVVKRLLNIETDPLVIFENYLKSQDIEKDLSNIEYQDVAPILYLYYEMNGYPEYTYIKHLIIDEAQDYTPLEFVLLKKMFNSSVFTIVGDINQRLNKYADYKLEDLTKILKNTKYIKLSKTYRSSEEIVEYTNKLIGIKNVESIRGKNNIPVKEKHVKDIVRSIKTDLKSFEERGFKVNAIITTDEKSCEEIKAKLSNIELKNTKVLPFYLAKGLEFEGIILYDKASYLKNNKNIFYVSATRAREMLIIYN